MANQPQTQETVLFDRSSRDSRSFYDSADDKLRSIDEKLMTNSLQPVPDQVDLAQPSVNILNQDWVETTSSQLKHDESKPESSGLVGFEPGSDRVITLRQPLSLLIVKLIGIGLVYYLVLWLLHRVLVSMLSVFPKLMPGYPVNNFLGSPMFFWGSLLFILIAVGLILRWWTIFFQISKTEVVAHSGIIIKQAKVLKRVGISIRQIEIRRNLLGMLLNYVTIEIGSEVMGGVTMTISDRPSTLQLLTDALKPGEVLQTKKLF